MAFRVIGAELECPAELPVAFRPIPAIAVCKRRDGRVSLSERGVEFQGLVRSGLRSRKGFLWRQWAPEAQQSITFRETGIGEGVSWVLSDRLFEMVQSCRVGPRRLLVEVVAR